MHKDFFVAPDYIYLHKATTPIPVTMYYHPFASPTTAGHEFGLILGLGHQHQNGSIMTYDQVRSVTDWEANQIVKTYGN